MKKNKLIISLIFIFSCVVVNNLSAQSDYEIVQNFKKKLQIIEEEIKRADSLDALNDVELQISRLKSEFIPHKNLLDGGLYPNSFDVTLDNLMNILTARKNNFLQQNIFQTEVAELKEENIVLQKKIDTLSLRNNELARSFRILEQQNDKQIAQLEESLAELRSSLLKRDLVVMNMIDGLLPSSYIEGEELSPREKHRLVSETEKSNALSHLKRVINDNIKFLEITKLYPEDITDLRNRQQNFMRLWKEIDTTMIELYTEKGKSTGELKEINTAFARWDSKLDQEVWDTINEEFANNNIRLQKFSSGRQFTSIIVNFIDDEIKNADTKGTSGADTVFKNFKDNTWDNEIKPNWVPFLIENNLLAEEQKDTIEVMIASWKNSVYSGNLIWLYIIIGVLAAAAVIFYISRKKHAEEKRIA